MGYNYYWAMDQFNNNHAGTWTAPCAILSMCWREATPPGDGPFHTLAPPQVVFLLANIDKKARDCVLDTTLELYGSHSAVAQDLRLNPDAEEGGWDDWEAQPGQIVPVGGKARITRQLRLQPHEVYVVKLAAVGSSP